MQTFEKSAIHALYHVPENGKAEIVEGKIIRMSPTGRLPNRAARKIWMSLYQYEQEQHQAGFMQGVAVADNAGFRVNLPHRESFSPDAAFYIGDDSGMKFFDGAPVFASEVRSESDYGTAAETELAAKRADYFAAGTRVVWDVDLLNPEIVRVYRADSPDEPTIYYRNETADAEPALPGWRMPVNDLFR